MIGQSSRFKPSPFTSTIPLNTTGIKRDIIVIGASIGGVPALQRLFAALPPDLPAAVGVVLHRWGQPGELASVLAQDCSLPIVEPREKEPVQEGTIYLAPADQHMVWREGYVTVEQGPKGTIRGPRLTRCSTRLPRPTV
jgi:two-component system, chemotaxis family, protein-glutamate methylesterase/glutaminase